MSEGRERRRGALVLGMALPAILRRVEATMQRLTASDLVADVAVTVEAQCRHRRAVIYGGMASRATVRKLGVRSNSSELCPAGGHLSQLAGAEQRFATDEVRNRREEQRPQDDPQSGRNSLKPQHR